MGVVLIIAAVAIFFRRIRDYALARADSPTRTRYSGPITVVFGAVLGVLVSLCSVGAGLSAAAARPHRRLRPCTRGAPHPRGRPGPLAHRQRGLVHCWCATARFPAGNLNR